MVTTHRWRAADVEQSFRQDNKYMESVVNMGKAGLISGVQKKGTKVGKGKGKVSRPPLPIAKGGPCTVTAPRIGYEYVPIREREKNVNQKT